MGFRERPEYSKEAYEKAKGDERDAEVKADFFGRYPWILDNARKRLEKLYTKGEKEATDFNKEYDRLFIQAQEALKALEDFEREKLGMHQEKEEEKVSDSAEQE